MPRDQNAEATQLLTRAISEYRAGNILDAHKLCATIVEKDKNNVVALHLFGVLEAQQKNTKKALWLFDRALAISPNTADILADKGKVLTEVGQHRDALLCYQQAVSINPKHWMALHNQGCTLLALRSSTEALGVFDRLIEIIPNFAPAFNNRGVALKELKRYEEAVASYQQAIVFNPQDIEAWCNLGDGLFKLKRHDEAFAAYDKALALKSDFAEAWLGRGNIFRELRRYDEAISAYDQALALKPDLAEAWLGRGNVFIGLKRHDEAILAFEKALALEPDLAEAWNGRGNVCFTLKRHDEAFVAYDKALVLKPDLTGLEGVRFHTKMQLCDWSNFDTECEHLISSIRSGNLNTPPLPFLTISSSPKDQFQCAKLWIANKHPPSDKPIWQGERYNHDRIRVAYLSADFCEHALSLLIAGMFECHDKTRFDVTAISVGPDDNSEIRQRFKESFERFIDAKTYRSDQIANLVKSLEVDILLDMIGFTANSRTSIFTRRPAPIQVNCVCYTGTMGAEYIDYIIADRIVIPENHYEFYSEKITLLPNSYQPNDAKRSIGGRTFTRTELGLPPTTFVFCCFNNNFKITPHVFDCWMRILNQVEGSVLWLLEDNATAATNLRKQAVARGINAERLIFAKRVPLPDHLARHRLADLFLDTLPYNAHTTASDALWVGLPVLTCIGDTFAGRVAASMLNAIRLPELITTTLEAYEQMAVDLAMHPEKLAIIKRKLADNRLITPLFDTKLYTKHIEAAYTAMYERHQAGLTPDHIVIPN